METNETPQLVYGEQILGSAPPQTAHTPVEKDWRDYMEECRDFKNAWRTIHTKHYQKRWMAMLTHKPRLQVIAGVWADDRMIQEEWRQDNRAADLLPSIKRVLTGMAYMLGPDTTMKMMNLNGRVFITAGLSFITSSLNGPDMEPSDSENLALSMLAAILADSSCELYPTDPRCGYIHLAGQLAIPFRFLTAIMPIVEEYFDARDEALAEGATEFSA